MSKPFASSCAAVVPRCTILVECFAWKGKYLVQGFDTFHVRSFTPELGDASKMQRALTSYMLEAEKIADPYGV